MRDDVAHDNNPYASPESVLPPGVGSDGRLYSTKAPADVFDLLVVASYVIVLSVVLMGLPYSLMALAEWGVPDRPWLAHSLVIAAGLATLPTIIWLVWFSRTIVASVAIGEEGIRFLRMFSRADEWPWQEITSVRPAPRREVIWDGLIRPLLFPRMRSNCSSTLGHYRIQGRTGYCFFPPKNPEAFVEAIARYRPDLLEL